MVINLLSWPRKGNTMFNDNILLLTDSYKVSHAQQYESSVKNVYSYLEARGGEFKDTVFFGLQYLMKRYLEGQVVTQERIEEAAEYYAAHFGDEKLFNRKGWEYILNVHGGRLPVKIDAVDEGTVVPTRNVLVTVENTDDECHWLTNYLETLLVQVWYPTTVATISRSMKQSIMKALKQSSDDVSGIDFKLHDFGCRGSTSMESAALGGAAHLVNFKGTDTVPALQLAALYYNEKMAGHSIPAAEHSTITSWGRHNELEAYRNMLKQFPTGLVAVVSDSYDIYNAVKYIWGRKLKTEVMDRKGTLVIRPDSGDPKVVVPDLLSILDAEFGGAFNDKGYRVLPKFVRLIQGDGINRNTLVEILNAVMARGYSVDNIAFGSGGGLLQDCNRDTCQFAFKCSSVEKVIDGVKQMHDVYKQPSLMASKCSKRGRFRLLQHSSFATPMGGATMMTVNESFVYPPAGSVNLLQNVFLNGVLTRSQTFKEIREKASI